MRIIIISERLYPYIGGSERRWDEIGKKLSERGHEVFFITGRGDITNPNPNPYNDQKIESYNEYKIFKPFDYSCKRMRVGNRSLFNLAKLGIYSSKLIAKLKKLMDIDIIDVNAFPFVHLPYIYLNYNPLFITWHEVMMNDWLKRPGILKFGYLIEKINAKMGKNQICVSKFTYNKLLQISSLDRNNIHLVENGVSDKFFRIKDRLNIESPKYLYVGRLVPDKNISSILVPSFRKVLKKYPKAELNIVGNGTEFKKILKTSKLIPNINLFNNVDDRSLLNFYKNNNVFVIPSSKEGSSLASKEALTVGLPVVTLNHQNNSIAYDVVDHGKNGYISDSSDFHKYMILAFENHDSLSQNAKLTSLSYKWQDKIDKLEKIYISQIN